jgi:hypothetical protein
MSTLSIRNNDSSSNGANPGMGVMPSRATNAAREDFGSFAVSNALFAARSNPNFGRTGNEADMPPSHAASIGLFRPSMQAQRTFQESQDLPGLYLGNPEAAGCPEASGYPPSFSLQQQQQMQQALLQQQHALLQQQQMQHALALHAGGGFASYGNSFASARMNEPSSATASLSRKFPTASLLPFATMDPSLFRLLQRDTQNSLSPDAGLSAALARPLVAAEHDSFDRPLVASEQDWSRQSAATRPSASLPDSTSQRLLGGQQEIPRRPPPPAVVDNTTSRTEDLHMSMDDNILSDHQIVLRKQMEFFVCRQIDIDHFTPGRRKELSIGQVGIRCKHCAGLPPSQRPRGTLYFPSTLRALYQAGQNMASIHFSNTCRTINSQLKSRLIHLQEKKAVMGHGGKKYWAEGAMQRGIYETERGLRFREE